VSQQEITPGKIADHRPGILSNSSNVSAGNFVAFAFGLDQHLDFCKAGNMKTTTTALGNLGGDRCAAA